MLLEATRAILGILGSSWGALDSLLGCPGALSEPSWDDLETSWAGFEVSQMGFTTSWAGTGRFRTSMGNRIAFDHL